MVERTKKTSKDIPIELVGLMSGIIVAHCLMVLALTMMVKYNEVDVHSVYLVVFEQMGRKCAKYLVSICALRGMPTSSLTSRYKAIDSFFRTVENLEACCQIGVSKIVMASSVVLRLVLFTRLMYYTSLPILASIIPSAALSELIDINEADSFEVCNSGVGFLCTNIALDLKRKLQAWIDLRRGFEAGLASIMVDCVLLDGW
ncbi:hypothetical protein V6N11_019216 [Hibiscus sabdariffa]